MSKASHLSRRGLLAVGVGGGSCLIANPGAPSIRSEGPPLDFDSLRISFSTNFADPKVPVFRADGGPFSTRFERFSGARTLPPNGELELYVDRNFVPSPTGTDAGGRNDAPPGSGKPAGLDPFAREQGCLVITATKTPSGLLRPIGRPYVSGMISTDESFVQRYGYFEMRAELPHGKGLWPAFWLFGTTKRYRLELDVVEALGKDTRRIYQSAQPNEARGKGHHMPLDLDFDYSDGLHDYGLLWTPDRIVYYVDRQPTAMIDGAPFRDDVPVFMIANLAVGGSWGGDPGATTQFPARMRIEHIRAYQVRGNMTRSMDRINPVKSSDGNETATESHL